MLTAVEHVQIPVRRMDRAIDWYVEHLGFRLQGRDGDRIAFLTLPEGPLLMLWRTGDDTAARFSVDGADYPVILYRTERIHELRDRLAACGARIQAYRNEGMFWVLKWYDTEGNVWGALQMNPPAEEAPADV